MPVLFGLWTWDPKVGISNFLPNMEIIMHLDLNCRKYGCGYVMSPWFSSPNQRSLTWVDVFSSISCFHDEGTFKKPWDYLVPSVVYRTTFTIFYLVLYFKRWWNYVAKLLPLSSQWCLHWSFALNVIMPPLVLLVTFLIFFSEQFVGKLS